MNLSWIYSDEVIDVTVFVIVMDSDLFLAAHNLKFINPRVVTRHTIYQVG